jgi:hypothetical protein
LAAIPYQGIAEGAMAVEADEKSPADGTLPELAETEDGSTWVSCRRDWQDDAAYALAVCGKTIGRTGYA